MSNSFFCQWFSTDSVPDDKISEKIELKSISPAKQNLETNENKNVSSPTLTINANDVKEEQNKANGNNICDM